MIRVNYNPETGEILSSIQMADPKNLPESEAFVDVEALPGPIHELEVINSQIVRRSDLADIRRPFALEHILKTVARHRAGFFSDLPGQETVYRAKEAEARDYFGPGRTDGFPFLEAEVGITGDTLEQVAQVILNKADAVRHSLARLETIRLEAVKKINESRTEDDLEDALLSFEDTIKLFKINH